MLASNFSANGVGFDLSLKYPIGHVRNQGNLHLLVSSTRFYGGAEENCIHVHQFDIFVDF
jgi:hypothetical protein